MRECTNWRGITLLPVIRVEWSRLLISRIKKGVDNILRKEQAGFRENRRILLSGTKLGLKINAKKSKVIMQIMPVTTRE